MRFDSILQTLFKMIQLNFCLVQSHCTLMRALCPKQVMGGVSGHQSTSNSVQAGE